MLPDDEQLINYGEDSTLSITRSVERETRTSKVELRWERADGQAARRLGGAKVFYHEQKRTTYTIKSNSADGRDECLTLLQSSLTCVVRTVGYDKHLVDHVG